MLISAIWPRRLSFSKAALRMRAPTKEQKLCHMAEKFSFLKALLYELSINKSEGTFDAHIKLIF